MGDARLPVPADDPAETARLTQALAPGTPIDDRTALVMATSGTTGVPKGAMLTADALAASADATHAYLGGAGNWLLALPAHHIAGMQVLLRAIRAGHTPHVIDVSAGFDPEALVEAVAAMDAPRRYTSLVPTQLHKVLDSPAATDALRQFDAVLVGGAATPAALHARAQRAGIRLTRTYGMSETCGGCVYDGTPLRDTIIRIDDPDADGVGRVLLGGPTVALGYRGHPDHPAFAEPGFFTTDDLGVFGDGVLSIVGRADEAISSGGLTVIPQVVEAAILADERIADAAVFGMPDERLGERVVAAVVAGDIAADLVEQAVKQAVGARLDRYAVPREVFVVHALPRRGPGKIDRRTLREKLSDRGRAQA
ncbi:o-succinylbenzoate--CoA ligase [Gordonia jinhuaensis]|uniref:O-succinylbenzoic acid--CoA ligase MenE n=1 Tax=Gordonia jinhuaensis TaxID=1517702 RepID=A0A916SY71_9ACTN|nr:putative O-succinylbenzoic acid--CoA ligase MenE [Gordonia jinhuaensis]